MLAKLLELSANMKSNPRVLNNLKAPANLRNIDFTISSGTTIIPITVTESVTETVEVTSTDYIYDTISSTNTNTVESTNFSTYSVTVSETFYYTSTTTIETCTTETFEYTIYTTYTESETVYTTVVDTEIETSMITAEVDYTITSTVDVDVPVTNYETETDVITVTIISCVTETTVTTNTSEVLYESMTVYQSIEQDEFNATIYSTGAPFSSVVFTEAFANTDLQTSDASSFMESLTSIFSVYQSQLLNGIANGDTQADQLNDFNNMKLSLVLALDEFNLSQQEDPSFIFLPPASTDYLISTVWPAETSIMEQYLNAQSAQFTSFQASQSTLYQ